MLPLTGDVNALRIILLYHLSNGIFINGGLEGGVTNLLKTVQGNNLQVLSVCAPFSVSPVCVSLLFIHQQTQQTTFLATRKFLYLTTRCEMTAHQHISFSLSQRLKLSPQVLILNNSFKEPGLIYDFKAGYLWRRARANKSCLPVIPINPVLPASHPDAPLPATFLTQLIVASPNVGCVCSPITSALPPLTMLSGNLPKFQACRTSFMEGEWAREERVIHGNVRLEFAKLD